MTKPPTTNEAAERLRTYLVSPVETHPSELQTLLDAALAAERRRVAALEEGLYAAWKQGYYEGREDDEWRTQAEIEKRAAEYKARAILDEEAAR